jgi:hypothetical protein
MTSKLATVFMTILALLAISGCALTPQEIQSDAAAGISLGLNTAVALEPQEKAHITADVKVVAGVLNSSVIPSFFPNANAGQLWNSSVTNVVTLLGSKLAGTPSGPKIMAVLGVVQIPFTAALSGMSSPSAALSASDQAKALGFFSGISQGIASFTGDATLNPPVPIPAPTPPPPTPAPAPGGAPPK